LVVTAVLNLGCGRASKKLLFSPPNAIESPPRSHHREAGQGRRCPRSVLSFQRQVDVVSMSPPNRSGPHSSTTPPIATPPPHPPSTAHHQPRRREVLHGPPFPNRRAPAGRHDGHRR